MEKHVLNTMEDPLAAARESTVEMLQTRKRTFSLPQPFYNDARLFALDMQEIFEKEWLFAGMTCEIPTKGNFMTLDVGDNPIVIVRGGEGTIHAFHNVCRHRGSRLCTKDKGKVAKLVCPYHQWTYELDGRLLFAGSDMGSDFRRVHICLQLVVVQPCLLSGPSYKDSIGARLRHQGIVEGHESVLFYRGQRGASR